jgi:hypothetical protein
VGEWAGIGEGLTTALPDPNQDISGYEQAPAISDGGGGLHGDGAGHKSTPESGYADVCSEVPVDICSDTPVDVTDDMSAEVLWKEAGPSTAGLLSATQVSAVLKTSGFSKRILKKVWSAAKTTASPADMMTFAEFSDACAAIIDAGGTLAGAMAVDANLPVSVAVATVAAETAGDAPEGPSESEARKFRVLWEAAKPSEGEAGRLTAARVSAVLKTSGLARAVLKGVWTDAKTVGSPVDSLDFAEFCRACSLVEALGGVLASGTETEA